MSKNHTIIVTDGYALSREDLSWKGFERFGKVTIYDFTAPDQLLERVKDANILIKI